MKEIEIVDEDRRAELDRVSANVHYQIAKNFTEKDAEATAMAILEKYPAIVMRLLTKLLIHNYATVEGVNAFIKARENIFGIGGDK